MVAEIAVNLATEFLVRQNRRVYAFLANLLGDEAADYDLTSGFKTGGDGFISLQAMVAKTPNIFDILAQKLPNLGGDEAIDENQVGIFNLEYTLEHRSAQNFSRKRVYEKALTKDAAKITPRDREILFKPITFDTEITEEMKHAAMVSYLRLQKKVSLVEKEFKDTEEVSKLIVKIPPINVETTKYFDLISYLFYVIMLIEATTEYSSQIDWNSSEFVIDKLTVHEVKMALNFLGVGAMNVVDINKEFNVKVTPFGNQLWLVYVFNLLGTMAYQLPLSVCPMYLQAIYGQTTLFVGAYQYVFSFVQIFGMFIFHRASERIGRKPVFIIMFFTYALTNVFVAIFSTGNVSKMFKIDETNFNAVGLATCWAQIIIRAIQGFFGICTPICISVVADLAAPSVRARALGLNGAFVIVASTVSYAFVTFGVSNFSYCKKTPETKENSLILCAWLAAVVYCICGFIAVFVLKETSASLNAYRAGNKLGITIRKDEEQVKPDPLKKVFRDFCKNRTLVLIFFCYVCVLGNTQIISACSSTIAQYYLDQHMTELTFWCSLISFIDCGLAAVFVFVCLDPMIRKMGELKVAACVIVSSIPTFLYISSPPPINTYAWAFISIGLVLGIIVAEACLMGLTAQLTVPQNKATISGIMQVANSLGRVIFPLLWSLWMEFNIRDAIFANTLVATAVLFVVAFIRRQDILLTCDVEKAKQKSIKEQKEHNAV